MPTIRMMSHDKLKHQVNQQFCRATDVFWKVANEVLSEVWLAKLLRKNNDGDRCRTDLVFR